MTETPVAREIRIGIVDDHPVVGESLAYLLESYEGFRIVGQGSTGRDALLLALGARPDVLVLDLEMPGQAGLEVIASLRSEAPEIGILVLSAHPEKRFATALLALGVDAILHKGCDPADVVQAVREVAASSARAPGSAS